MRVLAPQDRVWRALRHYVDASLTKDRDSVVVRLLGTEPRSGFAVTQELPGTQVSLSGSHRFSRYLLVFELVDAGDGATQVSARTYADFPGVRGRVYRALVIGTRLHVVAVGAMFRSIRRASVA